LSKDFGGAYSSGSVQDLHLIPSSMRLPNGSGITKIRDKIKGISRDFQVREMKKVFSLIYAAFIASHLYISV
jgi:hypothetical protein